MKPTTLLFRTFASSFLLTAAFAHATTVTGTVTNKTTGKPAAGDPVVLVDVQAGMGEVAHATTDANGRYSLVEPGNNPYLVRVTHQGAGYFVAAPEGPTPANITVYDVAPKVKGVFIEADVLEVETENGQLKVNERFFVHNTSSPPTTQWSDKSFQVVIPADAVVDGVGGQRPNGLPTSIKMDPDGPKGHYAFNFPIQPDDGEKDTLFQLDYHMPYTGNKYAFHAQVTLPADNFAVLLPKSMSFTPAVDGAFKPVPEDPAVQTFILKNATPGTSIAFTISGTGSIPREQQGTPSAQQPAAMGAQGASAPDASAGNNGQPGGGIGTPIGTPDPLSKYKWWILGVIGLLLAAGAAFLLRKPAGAVAAGAQTAVDTSAVAAAYPAFASPAAKNSQLLNVLKEEMFALESEKIHGTIAPDEYAKVKDALETVLKRALNRK
ncbi:MAG: carboxypeptidase-like regulatory domain-containing protein [Terracidiphilus sp.]